MRDLINILGERLRPGPDLGLGFTGDELMELAEAIAMGESDNPMYFRAEKEVTTKVGRRAWKGAKKELPGQMIKDGDDDVFRWMEAMDKILAKTGQYGSPADIRLDNIGERKKTGEIVAFDV